MMNGPPSRLSFTLNPGRNILTESIILVFVKFIFLYFMCNEIVIYIQVKEDKKI